jgi:hypothetical protein
MSNKFKQQAAQQRAAVPQVDLESAKVELPKPVPVPSPAPAPVAKSEPQPAKTAEQAPEPKPEPASLQLRITSVDTSETPINRGFAMYPSRHRQVAKDLAYIEDRNPWLIIDDALEEYVTRHYGKEYKRRQGGA